MRPLTLAFEWLFFGTVLFVIWKSSRGVVWKTVANHAKPQTTTVAAANPLIRDEIKWNPTRDGNSLAWEHKGTIFGALIAFAISAALFALLYSLWINDPTPAPPPYILVDHLFPLWHHPFEIGSYIYLLFLLAPLAFCAIGVIALFGNTSYRLYPYKLERRVRLLGYERRKSFETATILLKITSENEKDPESAIWNWTIELDCNGKTELLFLDSVVSGGYLTVSKARAALAELSQVSRWPAKELVSIRGRPASSD